MMKQFAPIASMKTIQQMYDAKILPSYHLLLAHDVLDKEEEYRRLYNDLRRDDPSTYIILDNSLVELGHPMSCDNLVTAAKIVNPDCLILPDKLNDLKETKRMTLDAYFELKGRLPLGCGFMGVIQGKTDAELLECTKFMVKTMNLDLRTLAVPRVITDTLGSRTGILKKMLRVSQGRAIHLLGFSENLADDVESVKMPMVMGIDSAVPVRWGLMGNELQLDSKIPRRRADYLGISQKLTPEVKLNIEKVQAWINEPF